MKKTNEYRYGSIEHEKNMNQGKRPDQNDDSEKLAIAAIVVLFLMAVAAVVAKTYYEIYP